MIDFKIEDAIKDYDDGRPHARGSLTQPSRANSPKLHRNLVTL
jgi:hypothetical protein